MAKIAGIRIRWNEVNDRKLMVLALGNPQFDFARLATYFDGPAGVPASAKAVEERLAKLKRQGRSIAAEKDNPAGATAATIALAMENRKKPVAAAAAPVKKEISAKRKAQVTTEDKSEEDGDGEVIVAETDEEDEPPAPPAKKPRSRKTATEDKPAAKKTKSGKKDKEDKPAAKKAKKTDRAKIAPTGPKRVAFSDDEGKEARNGDEDVEAMEIDSEEEEESDDVKDEEM